MTTLIFSILFFALLTGLWGWSLILHLRRMDEAMSQWFDRKKEKDRFDE